MLAPVSNNSLHNWTIHVTFTKVSSNATTPSPYHTATTSCPLQNGVRITISVILGLLISFSLIGNLLLCNIVYRRPAMRSGINLLLANLALSDFANSLFNLPLTVVLFNLQYWPFGHVVCGLNVVLSFIMNIEKISILTAISVDRYFIIVKRKDTMTPSKAYVFITCSWLIAFIISLMPVLGWGNYKYRCGYIQCMMDVEARSGHVASYLIFLTSLTIFVPAVILIFAYSRIFRTVQRSCFRVENHPPVTPTAMHRKGRLFIDYGYKRRTSATIFLLCLVLMICLMPIGVLNVHLSLSGGFSQTVTRHVYLAFLWLSYVHGAINPLIYFSRIKKFREAVYDIWPAFCALSRLVPHRSKRRIRPHVTYQVGKCDIKVNCVHLT